MSITGISTYQAQSISGYSGIKNSYSRTLQKENRYLNMDTVNISFDAQTLARFDSKGKTKNMA